MCSGAMGLRQPMAGRRKTMSRLTLIERGIVRGRGNRVTRGTRVRREVDIAGTSREAMFYPAT